MGPPDAVHMGAMTIVSSYKTDPRFNLAAPAIGADLEISGLLLLAVERFREDAREALMTVPATRESYERSQVLTAAWKAAEPGVARAYEGIGLSTEFLDFTPAETMERYAKHLQEALELVTSGYRSSLSTVGRGGLLDASILDAARKAIQHEIDLQNGPKA